MQNTTFRNCYSDNGYLFNIYNHNKNQYVNIDNLTYTGIT